MPDWKELPMALQASGNMQVLTAVSHLVQKLADRYILVERGPGQWGVLRAAELAWLPSHRTLDELEKYFLPSHIVKADGKTDGWIATEVKKEPQRIALISRNEKIEEIAAPPGNLGPDGSDSRDIQLIACANCGCIVARETGYSLCQLCAKGLTK